MRQPQPFICGVVEGFYGRPWSANQRSQLFAWMQSWRLNTYLYAPKDDLKHRTCWRDPYSNMELAALRDLIAGCRRRRLRFAYAIAPGLDVEHSSPADAATLRRKISQLLRIGCRHFAILFDDIAPKLSPVDLRRFGSVAAAQSHVANELFRFLQSRKPETTLMFCPTAYCGRMCRPSVKDSGYLREIGARLNASIQVLWTGPEIVSEAITVESVRELRSVIRRKPLLWDNIHANDYDLRRLYLGPYAGRPVALRKEVRGILSNPNCEFEANFVPLRTLATYARSTRGWNPHKASRLALMEWLPQWRCRGQKIQFTDLKLLADCFHLPYSEGETARRWMKDLHYLLRTDPSGWGPAQGRVEHICTRLQTLFTKMTALENRELLHVFYRRVWELKEEAALIRDYLAWLRSRPGLRKTFSSDEHRPGTYRGGLVAQLQRILPLDKTGAINHRLGSSAKGANG